MTPRVKARLINLTKPVTRLVFALLFLMALGAMLAHAQQQPAQDQPKVKKESGDREHARGPAQELAHSSNEAAGEEKDETEEFKQSASVQLVSKWTGLDLRRAYWLCVITNFVVIGAIIVWAGRKSLPGLFRARTAAIQKAMQEAQKASAEARAKLAEIESRLAKLDSEIAAIGAAAETEAAAEQERMKAATEEDARKIVAAAEQEIAAAAKAARRQLTAYAGELAVSLAQKKIHVDAATDQALVRNFAGQLGASGSGGSGSSDRSNSGKDGN